MLAENGIPDREPELSVGIVMPDDGFKALKASAAANSAMLLSAPDGQQMQYQPGESLEFSLAENGMINAAGQAAMLQAAQWRLQPNANQPVAPANGIVLHDVVAGREYHWKRWLDVPYPGEIEIRRHGDHLIAMNHVSFEIYLACVATSEMGADCPQALIAAQTVAARSWMLANVEKKHRKLGMDVCNDDCCQRYQGTAFMTRQSLDGALATRGEVLMHSGKICDARYSKSCGGMMESFDTIWGGKPVPYLQVKRDLLTTSQDQPADLQQEDTMQEWLNQAPSACCSSNEIAENTLPQYLGSVDVEGKYYRWQVRCSQEEMRITLSETIGLQARHVYGFTPEGRGGGGRLRALTVHYGDHQGNRCEKRLIGDVTIRAALHEKFLYSSAIQVDVLGEGEVPDGFLIRGGGWGHGVGLCQIGALALSLQNVSAAQILEHYYPGSELKKLY